MQVDDTKAIKQVDNDQQDKRVKKISDANMLNPSEYIYHSVSIDIT
jgi:hypothetical protein